MPRVVQSHRSDSQHVRKHGHAYGNPVTHLVTDHRLRAVGHLGGDLDAAVHRLRVHDDGIRMGKLQTLARESPGCEVLIRIRQVRVTHALFLDAQHHHHIRPRERRIETRVAGAA